MPTYQTMDLGFIVFLADLLAMLYCIAGVVFHQSTVAT